MEKEFWKKEILGVAAKHPESEKEKAKN